MIIKRFFTPRWRHSDPEIRRQTLLGISSQETAILAQAAREDEVPELRHLALSRLNDFDLLLEIADTDPEANIREFARQRYRELLAGLHKDSPPLSLRLDILAGAGDPVLLEYLALHAMEPELRRLAIRMVQQESTLGEIAVHDPVGENRLMALEKIAQRATLEQVFKQSRNKDKQVSRRAREKLDILLSQEEHPARVRARCEKLCASLESLGKSGTWDQDYAQFQRLERQWQELEAEAEQELLERFSRARDFFLLAFAEYQQTIETEQRVLAERRTRKEELLGSLDSLAADLRQWQELDRQAEADVDHRLQAISQAWAQVARLPEPEEERWQGRFRESRTALVACRDTLRRFRESEEALQGLHQDAHALLQGNGISESRVQSLVQRWQKLLPTAEVHALARWQPRIEELLQTLQTKLTRQKQQVEEEFVRLSAILDALESALERGEAKQADALHGQAQAGLQAMAETNLKKGGLASLESRLRTLTPRWQELASWRKWGAQQAREKLCEEMESLIGKEADPIEIARQVRAARANWKRLDTEGGSARQAVWRRFHRACNEAYAPCQLHFELQAEVRKANLEAQIALCERLEGFLAATDWAAHTDWKSALNLKRSVHREWQAIGPVDRQFRKEMLTRFQQAQEALNQQLEMERQRSLRKRQSLIEQVAALQELGNLHEATEKCKRLQKEWETTVPGTRSQEKALWEAFRSACDAVFARRQQQVEEREKELQQHLERRQALCAEIEALTSVDQDGLKAAQRRVQKIHSEWQEIGPVPKGEASSLEKRYTSANQRFTAHCRMLEEKSQRALSDLIGQRAGLCQVMESLLEEPPSPELGEKVTTLQARWEALAPLAEAQLTQAFQTRFMQSCTAVLERGEKLAALLASREANLAHRKELCLRMEVLAGVDSPPEDAKARMQYQVSRLTRALKQGPSAAFTGSAAELERAWYLNGPVPSGEAEALEERFARARDAYYSRPPIQNTGAASRRDAS